MNNILIPVGTDLNKIIDQLNQEQKALNTNKQDFNFEQWIFEAMPEPMPKMLAELKSNVKKDTSVLATLVVLSALMKDYCIYYDDKKEGCQLYVYILGDPAQGKGSVAKYKELGNPFHKELYEEYRQKLTEYKQLLKTWKEGEGKNQEPEKPMRKTLFVSGNSSKAALIRDLVVNDGFGLIFETETDTLYTANRSEYGNFTDILRKAFHSENLSVSRAGLEEGTIELDQVNLSVLMTSTLDQLFKLIPTYDNGLFSRFIFYILPPDLEFKQVFTKSNTQKLYILIKKMGEIFREIGFENLKRYEKEFVLTPEQEERFMNYFLFINECFVKYDRVHLKGNVNRMGVIFTRIAMLLTYLRNYTQNREAEIDNDFIKPSITGNITCNEIDFEITSSMIKTIICHILIIDELYRKKNPKQQGTFLIHSDRKHNAYKQNEAIKLREQGLSYSQIAKIILNNPNLKGTIKRWVAKKESFPVSVSETETNWQENNFIEVESTLRATTISFFDNVTQSVPSEEFNLYSLLTTELFEENVALVWNLEGEQQKKAKLSLPAYTPSGLFKNSRKKENLEKHSGFICVDIDKKDNLHIENFAKLKQELRNIVNIAFIGRSVSGKGYYVLIPIDNPDKHEAYFNAIQVAFNQIGIVIDKSCKDVTRMRIVSYDKENILSKMAMKIKRTLENAIDLKSFSFIDNEKFIKTLKVIEREQIDITNQYNDWFSIGCALANTFGEDGRVYFQRVSRFHKDYDSKKCDEQFSACLKGTRENGFSLGTFFYLAYQKGVIV